MEAGESPPGGGHLLDMSILVRVGGEVIGPLVCVIHSRKDKYWTTVFNVTVGILAGQVLFFTILYFCLETFVFYEFWKTFLAVESKNIDKFCRNVYGPVLV